MFVVQLLYVLGVVGLVCVLWLGLCTSVCVYVINLLYFVVHITLLVQ